ncbi:MAG: hypothetical protein KC766_41010 [Myxococcales bacterium]|nr:hypothetical protein [Myxococcales bacterium]
MSSLANSSCGCGCVPCACVNPPGDGCLPVTCSPRPCFFDGQLMGADDLNAAVTYARNQQLMINRFLGGWGVLGGMRLDAPEGARDHDYARMLAGEDPIAALTPNPQILAGTVIMVSAGAALDALGRPLVQCEPISLNVQELAKAATGGSLKTGTCAQLLGPYCTDADPTQYLVTEFYLVAEFLEEPQRPAPRFSGGGACDPAPSCDYSRKVESVRYSLVGELPVEYQITGCLTPSPGFQMPDGFPLGSNPDPNVCRDEVFAFIDLIQGQLAAACCSRPAVVLGKVLLTREPGALADGLVPAPLYTILMDSYPERKLTMQQSVFTRFFPNMLCSCAVESTGGEP